eukprot:TRINITY_DN70663_c0_g1_i1.p1 TRINITY_DN70663_c0_g1~~TRINITY_DN70663_c0_g1_i1.p1  ORF type:complete len:456 (+),score=112.90 TRINITY_DN70663_c0_g1_i1:77-1444(+)
MLAPWLCARLPPPLPAAVCGGRRRPRRTAARRGVQRRGAHSGGPQPGQDPGEYTRQAAQERRREKEQTPPEQEPERYGLYGQMPKPRDFKERIEWEENLKWRDFIDEKGTFDAWDWAMYNATRPLRPLRRAWDFAHGMQVQNEWEQSQDSNPAMQARRARLAERRRNLDGDFSQWSGNEFVGLEGFRVSGGKRSGQKPGPEMPPEDDAERLGASKEEKDEEPPRPVQRLPNPFKVLQLPLDATERHAADNYRKLARRLHPDAPEGSADRMTELNIAYELVKQIFREGGLEKSVTAKIELEKEGETGEAAAGDAAGSGARHKKPQWERPTAPNKYTDFGHQSQDYEEREELRRMAYAFKTSTRAAAQRRERRSERRRRFLAGARGYTFQSYMRAAFWTTLAFISTFAYWVRMMQRPESGGLRIYDRNLGGRAPKQPLSTPPSQARVQATAVEQGAA